MRNGPVKRILAAAALVLAAAREGHVSVSTLKKLKLDELAARSPLIVTATPLTPLETAETLTFADSAGRIPPLKAKAYRFKRMEIVKNSSEAALPETLTVFDYYTGIESRAHAAAHTQQPIESPVTGYYESSLPEKKLGKEKSVILFLTEYEDEANASPRKRLQFAASGAYEKASKLKAVKKLAAPTESSGPLVPKPK
jgi:hypothetical protein